MKIKGWLAAILTVLALSTVSSAVASGRSELIKQIESSILLTGTIDVDLLGQVKNYEIGPLTKVPASVQTFLDTSIRSWKFEIGTLPNSLVQPNTLIRNKMSARVVAKADADGNYQIRIAAASFDPISVEEGEEIRVDGKLKAPAYPSEAGKAGVGATVYLLLKIGADGQVQDAVTEQVNMRTLAHSERAMQQWRDMFSRNAMKAAKRWRFIMPADMVESGTPYQVVRAPVLYSMRFDEPESDDWVAYVPGPVTRNPWEEAEDEQRNGFSPDALAAGGIYMTNNKGLRLLTPLQMQGG